MIILDYIGRRCDTVTLVIITVVALDVGDVTLGITLDGDVTLGITLDVTLDIGR